MGYELWTSDLTGHRRTGTRLFEIRRLFEKEISTASILESLMSCPADASADEMRQQLDQRDFEVAGVKNEQDGPLLGFVSRSDLLSGLVRDHLRPFEEQHLIADSTPLADIISILSEREFQFVLVGPNVQGIVVSADLNKPPVRIFLFALVSLLEMHLSFWIGRMYSLDDWKSKLSENRLQTAIDLFAKRKQENQEITLLSCLQFCDKRDLFLANREIREKLGIESRQAATYMLKDAEKLRNHLAHSQDDIAAGTTWSEVAKTILGIEKILRKSDEIVEREAESSSSARMERLWA